MQLWYSPLSHFLLPLLLSTGWQGIGMEISKILHREGLTTVMTARNKDLGKAAQAEVAASEGSGPLLFHPLDISNRDSVSAFASWAKQQFPGGIHVLVNNAGMAYKGNTFGPEEAQTTLGTNFHGTMMLMEALLPQIKDNVGRVVVVSSRCGFLQFLGGCLSLSVLQL
jgi:NAD(P)-dependent dehydrogenase (short-subunit alcohol dehydrogenase family)